MAAKTARVMEPTDQLPGVVVVTLARANLAHPGAGHRVDGGWIASCRVGDKHYTGHSFTRPLGNLLRHLRQVGIPDAPLLVRTAGGGESRHRSFHQLAGVAAPVGRR